MAITAKRGLARSGRQRVAMRDKRKVTAKARICAHSRSHGRQEADSADQARLLLISDSKRGPMMTLRFFASVLAASLRLPDYVTMDAKRAYHGC